MVAEPDLREKNSPDGTEKSVGRKGFFSVTPRRRRRQCLARGVRRCTGGARTEWLACPRACV